MIHNSIQNQFMLADQLSISESASHSRMQQNAAGCWFLLSFQQLLASQKSHRRFGLFHGEPWRTVAKRPHGRPEIRLGLASQGLRTRPDLAMSLHLSEWPE